MDMLLMATDREDVSVVKAINFSSVKCMKMIVHRGHRLPG